MNLSKNQREELRKKFDGKCAYCGCELKKGWHADHFLPVERELEWIPGHGPVATGKLYRPENDTVENMMPSCPPCNIDKHSMSLEGWRRKLQDSANVLSRHNPTYRHAKRFGLIQETGVKIKFYFEDFSTESDQSK